MSPAAADVIVIGAGVAGLSAAVQLSARGLDVLVLDQLRPASGATGRAAGLYGQMRSTPAATRMLIDGLAILRQVEARAGFPVFHQTGSLRVAQTEARKLELLRDVRAAQEAGLDVRLIDPPEFARRLPFARADDLLLAAFCPTDGSLHPPDLARAYEIVARRQGSRFESPCRVEKILLRAGAVAGVRTSRGTFEAPIVVNAAGPWSYLVADLAEASLPTAAIGHYYFTTAPEAGHGVDPAAPSLRDRENRIYARPCDGGLRVGMYEALPVQYDMEVLPADFDMSGLDAPRDHPSVRALFHAAARRFPLIGPETPARLTTGIMSFTPDGHALIGQIPGVAGLFHMAGFCGFGVTQSPAAGLLLAGLILDGRLLYDLKELQADRFADVPELRDRAEVKRRCRDLYSDYYGSTALGPAP